MVGWVRSKAAVKSQMQTGSLAARRAASMAKRVGSAIALSTAARRLAQAGSTFIGSSQQVPRSRIIASPSLAQRIDVHLWIMIGCRHVHDSPGGAGALRTGGAPA